MWCSFSIADFTWCMSIHRMDVKRGMSLTVHKKCALPTACTKDAIGCKETGEPGVQVCREVFPIILRETDPGSDGQCFWM